MALAAHRLLIVGLDGAGWPVLDRLIADGVMPNLGRLAAEGARTELLSTIPWATLPAWTSFLTGLPPAGHGVTDLFLRLPNGYALVPATGEWRSAPTFLSRLSRRGLRVVSLGVPGTYPAERVRGVVVPGFDAPGVGAVASDAVWPPSFWPTLRSLGGWRFATFNQQAAATDRLSEVAGALLADLESKERVLLHLARQPWDLLFVHLQTSDTVLHHLWPAFDLASPRGAMPEFAPAVRRVFARIDTLLGRALAALPAEARVLLVSDHGMIGAANTVVHLNRFLARHGWLRFSSRGPARANLALAALAEQLTARLPAALLARAVRTLGPTGFGSALARSRSAAIDLPHSAAFSDELDYAPSIWLHRRSRFPRGALTDPEADRLTEQIAAALLALRHPDTGTRLVHRVYRRDELPAGPAQDRLPDLLLDPARPDGYRVACLRSRGPGPVVTELPPERRHGGRGQGLPGVHAREGIFLAWGPGLPATDWPVLRIEQAGQLVFPLLDLPVPAELAAGLPAFAGELLPFSVEPNPAPAADQGPPRPAPALLDRLRQLGYLE